MLKNFSLFSPILNFHFKLKNMIISFISGYILIYRGYRRKKLVTYHKLIVFFYRRKQRRFTKKRLKRLKRIKDIIEHKGSVKNRRELKRWLKMPVLCITSFLQPLKPILFFQHYK